MFQQDDAATHTANSMQRFLEKNMVVQWTKEVWLPYSLKLNPLEYGIWGILQTKVNTTAHKNTNAQRSTIRHKWTRLSEAMVWRTCCAFRPRLERIVDADGDYFD
jgi:hypothetical protein